MGLIGDITDDALFIAWAAGFFDGEGCVYAGKGTSPKGYREFRFYVGIAQTDRRPLDALHARFGGSVTFRPRAQAHYKDQWMWTIRGGQAAAFLAAVLPFLQVKADVAGAALPVLFRTHKHGVPFTADEVAAREQAIAFIQAANHRGRPATWA